MAQTGPRDKATIEALKERMARDPLSRAFLQLAEEYRKAGRFEEAVQVCNEGLARHPGYHTARIALGRTYLDAGDLDSAHQALIEVLDSMPENHLAAKLLAEVQLRLGNRAGAADTYRSILSHYPGDREVEGLLRELEDESAAPQPPGAESPEPAAPLEMVDGGMSPAGRSTVAGDPTGGAGKAATGTPGPGPSEPSTNEASTVSRDEPPAAVPGAGMPGSGADQSLAQPAATSRPAGADILQTNTLAELYLRQGLVERAVEVYRAMLQVDPQNMQARNRLQELSGPQTGHDLEPAAQEVARTGPLPTAQQFPAGPAAAGAAAPIDPPVESAPGPEIEVDPPSSAARRDAVQFATTTEKPGQQVRRTAVTIDRLQRWLLTIRAGSTPAGDRAER